MLILFFNSVELQRNVFSLLTAQPSFRKSWKGKRGDFQHHALSWHHTFLTFVSKKRNVFECCQAAKSSRNALTHIVDFYSRETLYISPSCTGFDEQIWNKGRAAGQRWVEVPPQIEQLYWTGNCRMCNAISFISITVNLIGLNKIIFNN